MAPAGTGPAGVPAETAAGVRQTPSTAAAAGDEASTAEAMGHDGGNSPAALSQATEDTPLAFEPNQGQTGSQVDYLARGSGYTLFLAGGDAVFDLSAADAGAAQPAEADREGDTTTQPGSPVGAVVRMRLVGGSSPSSATGIDELGGASNYLHSADPDGWHTDVPHYGAVRYADVYSGVDAVYRSDDSGELEYDFHVAPGADPKAITVGFDGVEGLRLGEDGDLLLDTAVGTLRQHAPVAYQPTADGAREPVDAEFVRRGDDRVGFALGDYDAEAPLVIDPVVVYSTYLGGNRTDEAHDVAADDAGNAYVTGLTRSASFPTTTGAYDEDCATGEDGACTFDAFVTKLDTAGGGGPAVAYSTYLGGSGDDRGHAVDIDSDGAAYVTGTTASADFPSPNGVDNTCGSDADDACDADDDGDTLDDAFVAKLAPDGSDLAYGTYLGGSGGEDGHGVAVDTDGAVHVTGNTTSEDFTTTAGAHDHTCGDDADDACETSKHGSSYPDAFVTKVEPDGSELAYSTYLGGNEREFGRDITLDGAGNAYLAGITGSPNFPTTDDAFQATCEHCSRNAFVTALGADGSELTYSTYLSGSERDFGRGIALDDAGSVYVTGSTKSETFDDVAPDGFTSDCDSYCAFVTKFEPDGSALAYFARFGGTDDLDDAWGGYSIALDAAQRAYVVGTTLSHDFPTTEDAYDRSCCVRFGQGDGFLVSLSQDGTELAHSTLLGGDDAHEHARGVAVDSAGDVYVAGVTESGDFPTMDATQRDHGGLEDGFVVKLTPEPERPIVYGIDEAHGPTSGGTQVTLTGVSLGDVSEVRFGDQPVADDDLTVVSDETITVTSPPVGPPNTEPTAVDITATDSRGTSPPTSRARFSYVQGVWTTAPEPETGPREHHTATTLEGGAVLLAGGRHDGTALDSAEVYDPAADTFESTNERMNTARLWHSATRLDDGRVLVAGGVGPEGETLATTEAYDPTTGEWESLEAMETARVNHTATRLDDGRVLVAGGLESPFGQELRSAEIYDPDNPEAGWTETSEPLEHGRGKHTATLLDDGRVLVVGGIRLSSVGVADIPPAELYNPANGTWDDPASDTSPRRFQHTATKLTDGRVLVAGGITTIMRGDLTSNPPPTNQAALFDPAAGSADEAWQSTATMGTGHATHVAPRLADSRVLAAGGVPDYEVTDTEAYQPGAGGQPADWLASMPMLAARHAPIRLAGNFSTTAREAPAPHTGTLLSANPERFVADPAACGPRCGEVLVVGGAEDPPAEIYTPAPSVSSMEPTSGGEGTEVTLTGSYFTEDTEVLFGQTPAADVTVNSFDQLTATAPAGTAGDSVQVTVMRDSGLAAAPEAFTYPSDDTDGGDGTDGGTDDDGTEEADETEPAAIDDPDVAPGRVDDLAAEAQSNTEIGLSFSSVGADGDAELPPAGGYLVKQSTEPIDGDAAFEDAFALCGGVCSFGPAGIGDALTLTVTDLDPDTTYHYAVKARDEAGNLSELSNPAEATTTGEVVGEGPATACAEAFVPDAGFGDVAGSVHEAAIDCVAWYGITLGMGDLDGDGTPDYGPRLPITRDQMASFLARLAAESGLELPADAPDAFGDDDGSVHEPRINALAALGITEGKGDVDGDGQDEYAPRQPVTRDQMASFLIRLHQRVTGTLPEASEDRFGDDDGSVHEGNINALAALGITEGKGDVDGDGQDEYAPREPVFRDQMASFLARHLDQLAEAGAVHPGGAEVLLDATQAGPGEELTGHVRSNRQVTGLTAEGCGLTGQTVSLGELAGFTVGVPADQSAGTTCELTLTATVQPVDPAAEGDGQQAPYRFDVTVTE